MANISAAPAARSPFKPSLDWLLIFVPISIALRFLAKDQQTALFITSCIAIIPLAGWMGKATEHLAEHLGQGIGGLLNATFGNAAELIIALIALSKGLTEVVKASITGSIIGNILLVLGLSFVAGGLKFPEQRFNRTAASTSATTLSLAAIALLIPAVFHQVAGDAWTPAREQQLSLAVAIVLIVTYAFTLYFSLRTHKDLFVGESHAEIAATADAGPTSALRAGSATQDAASASAHATATAAATASTSGEHGGEHWSKGKSAGVLLVATVFVAMISEFLVGAIEGAREQLGLTEVFVGVIVVAIIGNAAEHSSAIIMAIKNKMDLSIGIAIGSSMQIALFVAPVLVFASYFIGPQRMDLEFTVAEIVAVIGAVAIVGQIASDGESNWLEGVQLLAVYIILGILFFFLPETHGGAHGGAAGGTGNTH